MYVDSHCHLSFPELASQLPQIREAMAAAGVDRALCICTTLEEFESVHALAMQFDNFWASAGVHPDNEGIAEPTVDKLLELSNHTSEPLLQRLMTEAPGTYHHSMIVANLAESAARAPNSSSARVCA